MNTERRRRLQTPTAEGCDNCSEELGPNPVRRGGKVYCCEACAFEAQRSMDCGGRSDSTTAPSVIEQPDWKL